MKKVTIILAVMATVLLSACKDEPSSGDLKDSLKLLAEPCKDVLSISGVEKTNGREGREPNTYIVSAKYEVKYSPLKEFSKRLEDAQEAAKSFNAEINDDYVKQLSEKIDAAQARRQQLYYMDSDLNAEDGKCVTDHDCRVGVADRKDKIQKELSEIEKQKEKWYGERQSMQKVKVPAQTDINPLIRRELKDRCITTQVFANFIPLHTVQNYFEDNTMQMNGEMVMIKTEKGWRLAALGL